MYKHYIYYLIPLIGLYCCTTKSRALKMDDLSFSFVKSEVLTKSPIDDNVVFFVGGKSCFVCSEEIIDFINEFDPGRFYLSVVSNDDQVKEHLEREISYFQFDQLELERHGFSMSDSKIFIFNGDDLIYENVVHFGEFKNINEKMKELNE